MTKGNARHCSGEIHFDISRSIGYRRAFVRVCGSSSSSPWRW